LWILDPREVLFLASFSLLVKGVGEAWGVGWMAGLADGREKKLYVFMCFFLFVSFSNVSMVQHGGYGIKFKTMRDRV
jgi:hypothetical protein